jgi:DNA polymerase-3 subunit delta'
MLFKDIIGQKEVKRRLIQTVKDQRVSHAQLFLGSSGVGKLALAIAYAQYVNCSDKKEDDSCGVCPSCIKFEKLAHPDLHFIYPVASTKEVKKPQSNHFIESWRELLQNNNGYINLSQWHEALDIENKQAIINKDDCNSIIKTLGYKSYEAEYKVMIIWMVEKLFHSAAPKILKILEEPPEKTLFILISENQDQILATIKSRTQIVKIPKLKDEVLVKALMEKKDCSSTNAKRIVNLSEGNYHKALANLESDEDEKENFSLFRDWMRVCYQRDVIKAVKFSGEVSKIGREKQKSFLNYALRTSRNGILLNLNQESLVKLENEELDFMKKFSPFINPANIQEFSTTFNEALFHIERNANPSILFLDLSLKLMRLLRLK